MKVNEAQQMLAQLRDVLSAGGAVQAAKGIDSLIDAFAVHERADLDRVLAALAEDLDPIARHAAALRSAEADDDRFNAAFEALKADKRIKAADLDQIGASYLGLPAFGSTFPTRAAKLKQIELRFRQLKSFQARGRVIESVGPWQ